MMVIGKKYRVPWSGNPHILRQIKPTHDGLHGDAYGTQYYFQKIRNSKRRPFGVTSVVTDIAGVEEIKDPSMTHSDEEIIERAELGRGWLSEADVARLAGLARRGLTAREEIEKTRTWLADVDVASLPNDFPLDEIARIRMQTLRERTLEGLALIGKAETRIWNEAIERAAREADATTGYGDVTGDRRANHIATAIRALKRT